MRSNIVRILLVTFTLGLAGLQAAAVTVTGAEDKKLLDPLENEIRKQLITMPFYGVFDFIEFDVQGDKVILKGDVSGPTLQSSASRVVERIPGVKSVENQIEVQPLSNFDNSIRRSMVRAIYGDSALNRYSAGANPWIRILVRNGNVTLEGYVDRETDKDIATIRARGVSDAFSITNNLAVKQSSPSGS